EQEEKEAERAEAREDVLKRKMKEQIKEAIRNFGDSGIFALFAIANPYNFICDEEAEKLGIPSVYNEIKFKDVPDDCPVGKLAACVRNSVNYIIDEKIYNQDLLEKIWNIFARDENIQGRKSIDDIEPTEDEILAEIAMKQAAEENEDESDENSDE
ncbi:MAG: hypothetical protein J6U57_06745, partial [Bacteroidales bacterium]|nr:hypothetical protein [Bacteroidales bacterium]